MTATVFQTSLKHLKLLGVGKVRDLYEIDKYQMLMVATDRLSAFDVVLPTPIPDKGKVLTTVSEFWFHHLQTIVKHHLLPLALDELPLEDSERADLEERCLRVRRTQPLPVEAIVRGHIIGSGWKDYQRNGAICGIPLPNNLQLADALPEPLFTPSTKADVGTHDENITFDQMRDRIGADRSEEIRSISLHLYQEACKHAQTCGIIIADTKFEFGVDEDGVLTLIDEVLTPDSSRFWNASEWQPGENPRSLDKQFVRDWLETQPWDKRPPGPELPPDIVTHTANRYRQIGRLLCGDPME